MAKETLHPSAADFSRLAPGLASPVHDAQASFRAVLEAMANPGRIVTLPVTLAAPPPAPLGVAAAAIALSLCDIDTAVWLDPALAGTAAYLRFHCGSPLTAAPAEAQFAFIAGPASMPRLDAFALGSDEYPDRSATVIIEVPALAEAAGLTLAGPGVPGTRRLAVDGLPARFWAERGELAELLPRGLDVIFACGARLAAVPRTTRVRP